MGGDLDAAVRAVVRNCLGVSNGESVLVICNPATEDLGERMRAEAEAAGGDASLITAEQLPVDGAEPPASVADAMVAADVVLAPTVKSLSHTKARRAATEAGARIATLPGVTAEMLARVMSDDMEGLRRRCLAIATALDEGSEARISCPNGSDLRLGLSGRTALADDGDLSARGAFGNLPCGEGFIAPVEGASEGTLVVDGSIAGIGLLGEPARLRIEGGHLTEASGRQGGELIETLRGHGRDGTNVAELGVGANEKAKLTGDVLEDEKILGTAHVAFGASASFGGKVQVPVHLDCVVTKPTVEVDGQAIVRDGELLVGRE